MTQIEKLELALRIELRTRDYKSHVLPLNYASKEGMWLNILCVLCNVKLQIKLVEWRREWDSNPRWCYPSLVFKTSSLSRSDISPKVRPTVK